MSDQHQHDQRQYPQQPDKKHMICCTNGYRIQPVKTTHALLYQRLPETTCQNKHVFLYQRLPKTTRNQQPRCQGPQKTVRDQVSSEPLGIEIRLQNRNQKEQTKLPRIDLADTT